MQPRRVLIPVSFLLVMRTRTTDRFVDAEEYRRSTNGIRNVSRLYSRWTSHPRWPWGEWTRHRVEGQVRWTGCGAVPPAGVAAEVSGVAGQEGRTCAVAPSAAWCRGGQVEGVQLVGKAHRVEYPFDSIVTLALVAGSWLIILGVIEIVSALGIRKAGNTVEKAVDAADR
jgi:hypothetical protein